jgi:RimJ/RimL family protein N-acetyltransferase
LIRRWWTRRRESGITAFTFNNRRSEPLRLWLEPWAEEFEVREGSAVEILLCGPPSRNEDVSFEWTKDHLSLLAPSDCTVRVSVDGREQVSASSQIPVPATGGLGTRGFVHTVFDTFPQAQPSGRPLEDSLGAAIVESDVRCEPLAEEHREGLKAACAEDLEIWKIYATSYDPDHFDESFDRLFTRPNWVPFAIFSGNRLVGISCYLGIDSDRGVLEIGNTYYVPAMRGTGFNRRVKDLMLTRAFDCGFRRVEFRVDARNRRSQAAMAKIGGVREGVIRQDRITWNGHVRDTVLFSILADEYQARNAG